MLWIYDLPTWLLAVLIITVFLTLSIGGLLLSTVATLFFVPVVFSVIRGRRSRQSQVPQINETPSLKPDAYDFVEAH